MKRNKSGISLIVLVITIIVMIILAAAVIIALDNSGIISKANEAVGETNLDQVQHAASLVWADAFLDPNIKNEDITEEYIRGKLKEQGIAEEKYNIEVTDKGVTVTENKPVEIPSDWKASVSTIVDGVPIPKGFVASPYDGTDGMPAENTKTGGLVIYALNEGETSIPATETHQYSLENRNQFVWVPVDKENFATEFVRDGFGEETSTVGEQGKYWELVLDASNMPIEGQNRSYVSEATELEARRMYASVKEYGGFYIARYEVGYDDNGRDSVSITMGKYPYNNVNWSDTQTETANDGGAVALSRAFYPNNSDNTTGVVSTLTYGVQWDTTLNWWTGKDLTDSKAYGNYYNTAIAKDSENNEYNQNAQYSEDFGRSWKDVVAKGRKNDYVLTTGAFKNANVNNIYDMAGNLYECTMEGYSSSYHRVNRGGSFYYYGYDYPVINRAYADPYYEDDQRRFPSLTLHKKVALVTCVAGPKHSLK